MLKLGIPYTVSIIDEAVKRGLKILTEVELSYLISEAPIIAVTVQMVKRQVTPIGDMFKKKSLNWKIIRQYWLCCNQHRQVAQKVIKWYIYYLVTELSSFQLLGIEKYKPHIAIITNIYWRILITMKI